MLQRATEETVHETGDTLESTKTKFNINRLFILKVMCGIYNQTVTVSQKHPNRIWSCISNHYLVSTS